MQHSNSEPNRTPILHRAPRPLHGLAALFCLAIFLAGGSAIVMALWNAILPAVCNYLPITFWQALGLLTLGLTLSGALLMVVIMIVHSFFHHRNSHDTRRALFEKWRSMTDEQRRDFLSSRGLFVDETPKTDRPS